jgi:hypothetical protein
MRALLVLAAISGVGGLPRSPRLPERLQNKPAHSISASPETLAPQPRPRLYLAHGEGSSFCLGCEDPYYEGLFLETWEAAHGPKSFHVIGELALGVPNDGHVPLRNDVDGCIVFLQRGGVSFITKAKNAQAAGALALIVADDGACGEEFDCGPRLGSRAAGQRLAFADSPGEWRGVTIPVVMWSAASARRIAAQTRHLRQTIPTDEFGPQDILVYR